MTFLQLVWKNKTIFIHKGKHPQEFLNVLSTCMINEGFPDSSVGKESACNAGDLGMIPGLGRSPEMGKATYSSILAWRIPWDCKESDTTELTSLHN